MQNKSKQGVIIVRQSVRNNSVVVDMTVSREESEKVALLTAINQ